MKRNTNRTNRKPERSIRIIEQPTPDTDGWGAVEITVNGKSDRYLVHFIPSDFGFGAEGFEVEKLDSDLQTVEQYHVHLSNNAAECSCDCKHSTYRPNAAPCRHIAGLRAVKDRFPRIGSGCDHRRNPQPQEQPNEADYEQGSYDPAS